MKNWRMGVSSALFSPNTIKGKLQECSAAGFDCIELGIKKSGNDLREYIKSIASEAKETDIEVWSIHLPFGRDMDISDINEKERNEVLETLFELIDSASILKPKVAIIHGSYEPIEQEQREIKILACIESLKTLVERCSEYGIKVALECLPRTCIGNCSSEILRILKAVPGLYVCFDTNHLTIENPIEFVKNVGRHIISTHVSDYDMVDERHWLPGKGCINWYELLSALKEIDYNGPIMFEVVNKAGIEEVTPKSLYEDWYALIDSFGIR